MQHPALNTDILATIVSFAAEWPGTIATMMQSCRLFYHEGPKVLLKKGVDFTDQWEDEIPEFLIFILAEGGTRCRYIGGLYFWLIDPDPSEDSEDDAETGYEIDIDPDVVRSLVEFLRDHSFPNLKFLELDPAEELLLLVPELAPVLTALPAVKHLQLHACGRLACAMAQGMDKLVDVGLRYDLDEERTPRPLVDIHPLIVLANSRNTLEELLLVASEEFLPSALYPQPFPRVTTLEMNGRHPPILDPFVHAFPNLHILLLRDREVRFGTVMPDGPIIHEESRRDMQLIRAWKLVQAIGPLRDLYLSGLACEVTHLQAFMAEESTYEALGQLLSDTRPETLIVQTSQPGMLDDATGLPAVLRSAGGRLKEFSGILLLHPEDRNMDMEAGFASLRASLSWHPLLIAKFLFFCNHIPERLPDDDLDAPSTLPSCPVEEYMATADLGALAQSFIHSIATLEMAHISFTGHRTRDREDARARRDGGSVVIERNVLHG
ncbi:hypothetical protein LXA43DRAFT_884950 [Ganoderma leucocontextum]|nr:hypothetical protein LXA43DRAFT_884950 [Ganoderma leucocontextum]